MARSRLGAVAAFGIVLSVATSPWFGSKNAYLFLISATAVSVTGGLLSLAAIGAVLSLPATFLSELRRAGSNPQNAFSYDIVRFSAAVTKSIGAVSARADRTVEAGIAIAPALLLTALAILVGVFVLGGALGLLAIGWRALFN